LVFTGKESPFPRFERYQKSPDLTRPIFPASSLTPRPPFPIIRPKRDRIC